jgi:collagenase-like PrtC family protease
MDVDTVYLGEVVCSKREPFFEPYERQVIQRLQKAGKEVVLSSLAMVTTPRESDSIKEKAKSGFMVEANDVAAVQVLAGKPFVVGPFINVMNEGTRDYLIGLGAKRIVLPVELSGAAVGVLASSCGVPFVCRNGRKKLTPSPAKPKGLPAQAQDFASSPSRGEGLSIETEVQVFGRQPLSVAMRCYAARAYGRNKDGCRFACGHDPDGLAVDAFDGKPILSVSGTMTLSHGYAVLLDGMEKLKKQGVSHFRLSPQDVDMVRVASLYRAVLTGRQDPESAKAQLEKMVGDVPFVNGFFHAREGLAWVD